MIRLRPLLHRRFTSSKVANIDVSRIPELLSNPTWSVSSLLPSEGSTEPAEITPATLHHLLRLSALPPPATPEKEKELLAALHNHLHFVRAIQEVDTEGVEPLSRIGDEVEPVQIRLEEVMGETEREPMLDWNPMDLASKKVGEFYVVDAKNGDEMEPVEAETKSQEKET
ncbi:hypothetical protein EDC01DRAFT_628386 [Geopyxis carbonaria]|nr:hypothetical protein EDC01DRAFT_628386 [Geopyxis carbonaria]